MFWFLKKKQIIYKLVYIEIWWGKTSDMHKRAFQTLKRTFMHVSGLLPPCFDLKELIYKVFGFLSNDGRERPETCINVRFRPWNARLCMSQLFFRHILIKKLIYKEFGFLSKDGGGRPETCINVRFRPWNARLIMSQVFPHHILLKKPNNL